MMKPGLHLTTYELPNVAMFTLSLSETKMFAPEKWWLVDILSFWGPAYFRGRAVSFREGIYIYTIKPTQLPGTFQISIIYPYLPFMDT